MKNFVKVIYETGSITAAAQKLYITQPALSISLRKLEKELGCELFYRGKNPLQLTEAGKIYLDAINKTENIKRQMKKKIFDLKSGNSGTVTIGAAHFITSYILLKIIKLIEKDYPKIKVCLIEGNSYELREMLKNGNIDILLDYNMSDNEFEMIQLFRETVYLAVPNEIECKDNICITRKEIIGNNNDFNDNFNFKGICSKKFIIMKKGNNMNDIAYEIFNEYNIVPDNVFETDQLVTAFESAICALGMTFVTDKIIKQIDDQGKIKYICLPQKFCHRHLYVIRNKNNYKSQAVKEFIQFMFSNIKEVN